MDLLLFLFVRVFFFLLMTCSNFSFFATRHRKWVAREEEEGKKNELLPTQESRSSF